LTFKVSVVSLYIFCYHSLAPISNSKGNRKRFATKSRETPRTDAKSYKPNKYKVTGIKEDRPKCDTLVKDLKPGSKNMSMLLIILEMGKVNITKDGHELRTAKVADKSGSVNLTIWDKPGGLLQGGDIIRIHKVTKQYKWQSQESMISASVCEI